MLKRTLITALALAMLVISFSGCSSDNAPAGTSPASENSAGETGTAPQGKKTLNVLNWGEYMDDSLIQKFSEEYGVEVNYNTCTSNEQMHTVVSTEGSTVDIIFPSDYMIERLIREGLLKEINYDNIPNFKYVSDFCRDRSFDPGNKYSVPYTWGTLGILYNKEMVTDPVDSWSILWNEKYKDNIYMYDSMRDSIAVALLKLGYSLNSKDENEIRAAGEELIAQKPLVKAYGTDDIKTSILQGSGAMGVVYSGDAITAFGEDEEGVLDYAVPKEGSNIWFDNITILKNSKNAETAEAFINFLLDPENGLANTEYIGYASPNSEVMKNIGEEYLSVPAFNPPEEIIERCEVYADLTSDEKIKALYEEIWNKVKAE